MVVDRQWLFVELNEQMFERVIDCMDRDISSDRDKVNGMHATTSDAINDVHGIDPVSVTRWWRQHPQQPRNTKTTAVMLFTY